MANKIFECRCCGNKRLLNVLDIGEQSYSGIFITSQDGLPSGRLRLVKCVGDHACGLVQLDRNFDAELMYGENYGYRSGLNNQMVRHLKENVDYLSQKVSLNTDDVVLDIGSNDGTTLGFFPQDCIRIGIDPTIEKFSSFYDEGIIQCANFFSAEVFQKILPHRKVKAVTAFSMFYDLPNPIDFAKNVAHILCDDGFWLLEQSDLMLMLATNSVDTICHEHTEYYSISALTFIFNAAGLKIVDLDFNDVNGGSCRLLVTHRDREIAVNSLKIQRALEREYNLEQKPIQVFDEFLDRFTQETNKLKTYLKAQKEKGYKIYGLGASTKGNTLLQLSQIDNSLVDAIGEVNSEKFGKFTPGTNIPICSELDILEDSDAVYFVLPWHFKQTFINQERFKSKTLLFPLPKFEVK